MVDMFVYVQEVFDFIEWVNGLVDFLWGVKWVVVGYLVLFGLKYFGVGNEDKIILEFKECFRMIYEVVKKVYFEIVVIGIVGFNFEGEDYDKGWEFVIEFCFFMVDEYYYKFFQWFWENFWCYDIYDCVKFKVYFGEYVVYDFVILNIFCLVLVEVVYFISLE